MKCDLCGKTEYTVVWDKTYREQKGIMTSIVIRDIEGNIVHGTNVICNHCGLVQVHPKMSKEELNKFYTEGYREIYNSGNIAAETDHAETAWKILKKELSWKDKKILDIGCSTGELISKVIIRGYNDRGYIFDDAYGIEPNTEHSNIAKAKGLNVENCGIEDYNPGITFDVITMLNALEHVFSPTDVLNKIHSLLNDNGYILISVPNIYSRTITRPVDAFLSNAHLYNFGINTLTQYFLKCGFKVAGQFQVVEEIGEKIYILGQKMDKKVDRVPKAGEEVVEGTIKHLHAADFVFYAKQQIKKMGFK